MSLPFVRNPVIDMNPDTTAFSVLPYVIDRLQEAGYDLVTVAECLGATPYKSEGAPGTPDVKSTLLLGLCPCRSNLSDPGHLDLLNLCARQCRMLRDIYRRRLYSVLFLLTRTFQNPTSPCFRISDRLNQRSERVRRCVRMLGAMYPAN